jgi:hypothetical protein
MRRGDRQICERVLKQYDDEGNARFTPMKLKKPMGMINKLLSWDKPGIDLVWRYNSGVKDLDALKEELMPASQHTAGPHDAGFIPVGTTWMDGQWGAANVFDNMCYHEVKELAGRKWRRMRRTSAPLSSLKAGAVTPLRSPSQQWWRRMAFSFGIQKTTPLRCLLRLFLVRLLGRIPSRR